MNIWSLHRIAAWFAIYCTIAADMFYFLTKCTVWYQHSSHRKHSYTLESLQHNRKNELKWLRILNGGNYCNILRIVSCSHLSLFPRFLTPSEVPSLNKCGGGAVASIFLHNNLNLINVKRDGYLPLRSLYEFDITASRNINGKWFIRLRACRSSSTLTRYIKLLQSAYEYWNTVFKHLF